MTPTRDAAVAAGDQLGVPTQEQCARACQRQAALLDRETRGLSAGTPIHADRSGQAANLRHAAELCRQHAALTAQVAMLRAAVEVARPYLDQVDLTGTGPCPSKEEVVQFDSAKDQVDAALSASPDEPLRVVREMQEALYGVLDACDALYDANGKHVVDPHEQEHARAALISSRRLYGQGGAG